MPPKHNNRGGKGGKNPSGPQPRPQTQPEVCPTYPPADVAPVTTTTTTNAPAQPALVWGKPAAGAWGTTPTIAPVPTTPAPVVQQAPVPTTPDPVPTTTTTTTTTTTSSSSHSSLSSSSHTRAPRGLAKDRVQDIDVSGLAGKKLIKTTYPQSQLIVNQFPLKFKTQKLFQYAVEFAPAIENRGTMHDILSGLTEHIGLYQYDGFGVLYSTKKNATITYKAKSHSVTVQYVKEITHEDPAAVHFYNILFKRFMREMGLTMIGRQYFKSTNVFKIEKHQLEVWPGFFTSVSHIEAGTSLLCDVAHKIVRTQSILSYIKECRASLPPPAKGPRKSDTEILNAIQGSIVITKTYRVSDIDWKMTPMSTFDTPKGKVSFASYYSTHYPKSPITDMNQPMIRSEVKRKGVIETLYLVPELCFLTGMSEEITQNRNIMMDLANHTNVHPSERLKTLSTLINDLRTHEKVTKTTKDWGFQVEDALKVTGHKLPDPRTTLNMKQLQGQNWALLCSNRDQEGALKFAGMLCNISGLNKPTVVQIANIMQPRQWSDAISANKQGNTFFFCVIPNGRKDVYDNIKKSTLTQLRVITQCAFLRTMEKGMPVATKIVHQLIAKLGRSPWLIQNPSYRVPANTMIVGIDVGHNSDQRGKSVVGFCASINGDYSLYHTTAIVQSVPGKEIVESLKPSMMGALQAYYKKNNRLPEVVIVYRDGVGDGMLNLVRTYEVAAIKEAFAATPSIYGVKPKLLYSIVKKSTNTRFFDISKGYDNPLPGTLIDKGCSHNNWYDFFLISQKAIKGSVNPTHYHVIVDETDITADNFQLFTYHMCWLYYNFDKSVRVPAPCQYAHKLAFLIGRHVHAQVAEELSLNLYFL
eukprot:gene6537-7571_t